MIERYVFLRLKDPAARDEVIERTRAVLPGLPGVLQVTVGAPADEGAASAWDVSIAVRFATLNDAERYRMHPDHRAYVDEFLQDHLEVIKAWNFQV